MLPKQYKLHRSTDFRHTMKAGSRAGSRTLVVHKHDVKAESGIATSGGPRFGLIVSKAVGNAVTRHATSRRLRHVCMGLIDELPSSSRIVIRALPAAGLADSAILRRDLLHALHKIDTLR